MIRCDALIVGGGPAGSTCARTLRRAGWDVVVADRATFPRDKVCAGWLTPGVFPLLELDPNEYRAAGLTLQEITAFRTGIIASHGASRGDKRASRLLETKYPRIVSYAIRRCEFDDFLLRRAGVRVLERAPVTALRQSGERWIVNESIETPVVIGAGGHFCPIARHLQGSADTSQPVVAKEAEFRLNGRDARVEGQPPELLFCRDLEGYGWCVRKGEYLNVGIGRRDSQDFASHVRNFIALLEASGRLRPGTPLRWRGHAYFASGVGTRPLVGAGMLIVGDGAGLAYPESGEGIHPAIASGRLAAETLIAAGGRHAVEDLQPYAQALGRLHPPVRRPAAPIRTATAAIGRMLLGSPFFTKRVLLDRWFLRMAN